MEDLAEEPGRNDVEDHRGLDRQLGTYHIRYSRKRVPSPPGRVKDPRHLIVFRAAEDAPSTFSACSTTTCFLAEPCERSSLRPARNEVYISDLC